MNYPSGKQVLQHLVLYPIVVFLYFLVNIENPNTSTYFFVLGCIECRRIAKFKERVISIY